MRTKILFGTLTVLAVLAGCMVAYGAVSWTQQISWSLTSSSFTGPTNPTNVNYEIVDNGTVKTEIYTVTNNGNVPVTVNANAVATGATVSWDKTTATIPVGESATFTLTLTIIGEGSCVVSFSKI